MKRLLLALTLAVGALAIAPTPALASKTYTCDCDPTDAPCYCEPHRYTIGKSGTTEFRGKCSNSDVNPGMLITDRDNGTSCTVNTNLVNQGYSSKSCTNWDPFTTDTVTVKLKCCTEDTKGDCWPGW